MPTYKTPGVYVQEITTMPPSVAEVETAIPVFIGFTQKGIGSIPKRVTSLIEYEDFFGGADPQKNISVIVERTTTSTPNGDRVEEKVVDVAISNPSKNVLYYALQLYYANGGGPCYILSTGNYTPDMQPTADAYIDAVKASSREDEPTLIVLPDAPFYLAADQYYRVMNVAVQEATRLGDRFAIIDVVDPRDNRNAIQAFRDRIVSSENNQLKYAAAYYPYLNTQISPIYQYNDADENDTTFNVFLSTDGQQARDLEDALNRATQAREEATLARNTANNLVARAETLDANDPQRAAATAEADTARAEADRLEGLATEAETRLSSLQGAPAGTPAGTPPRPGTRTGARPPAAASAPTPAGGSTARRYRDLTNLSKNEIKRKIGELGMRLTPSAAIAGVYASVDNARGVWKAPANVALAFVNSTTATITNDDQESLNVDVDAGKSINAIRPFIGKGVMVWGARTLDGNSNEWRYISVRRFFNMVEESIKKSTYWAVFEPNDQNTWSLVRSMIENYLILKWRDGALAGAKPDESYFVRVGLGQTMTPQDVLEGRMIVEIGLAAVRPAEFIILKFSHKMQTT